jgi:hypothetical protein
VCLLVGPVMRACLFFFKSVSRRVFTGILEFILGLFGNGRRIDSGNWN